MVAWVALLQTALVLQTPTDSTPHSSAELALSSSTFVPGQPIEAIVTLRLDRGWHTYWRNPGDSGMPTRLTWTLPPGWTAGETRWPTPRTFDSQGFISFGYSGEVHLLTTLIPGKNATSTANLRLRVDFLVCEEACVPARADLSARVARASSLRPLTSARLVAARKALPVERLAGSTFESGPDGYFLFIPASAGPGPFRIYPEMSAQLDHAEPVLGQQRQSAGTRLKLRPSEYLTRPLRELRAVVVPLDAAGAPRGSGFRIALPARPQLP